MRTTLLQIKAHSPCAKGWRRLKANLGVTGRVTKATDRDVSLLEILESNGARDCVWAFRAVEGHDREFRLLACYMARCVLPLFEDKYPDDPRPRTAIETAERYANGNATDKELAGAAWAVEAAWAAVEAAWAARAAWAVEAAEEAAWAARAAWAVEAAWAAEEAAWAARAAAWAAVEKYLRALLTGVELPEPYKFREAE